MTSKSNAASGFGSWAGLRTVRGSNGHDRLVGTGRDELFIPLLGHDHVDGRGGRDALLVDYGMVTPGDPTTSSIESSGGSFKGTIVSSGAANQVSFRNIEDLWVAFDDGDNVVQLDGAALAGKTSIALDGNGGVDTLVADFSALAGATVFRVVAGQNVVGNRGTYVDFENFELTLGNGADQIELGAGDDVVLGGGGNDHLDGGGGNDRLVGGAGRNLLAGGAGDDILVSTSGDTVRGGSGNDTWVGNFAKASQALTFTFNGATGAGSLSNGASLTGMEHIELETGSGNDRFTLTNVQGSAFIDAGAGTNRLAISATEVSEFSGTYASNIGSDGAGGLAGMIRSGESGFTAFSGIDHLTFSASSYPNFVSVDPSALLGGATLWIDAGDGPDWLELDLSAFVDVTFAVAPDGALSENIPGTYLNFESFWLTLGIGTNVVTTGAGDDEIEGGDGDDTVATGAGNDFIRAGAGVNVVEAGDGDDRIFSNGLDTINGGDGIDFWVGDYSAATTDLVVEFAAGDGALSNGVTFTSVELVSVITGSGDDLIEVTGPGVLNVSAGEGVDTLTVDNSSGEGTGSAGIGGEGGSFSGGMGSLNFQCGFNGVEHVVYTAGANEDYIVVGAAPLLAGATLSVDAGGGNDILEIHFTAFGDISFVADDAGNVATSVAGASFMNFENYAVRSGAGDDEIVTASGRDSLYGGGGTNVLSSGAGADQIFSQGVDAVDGGEDLDSWIGLYGEAMTDLVFTFDGSSGTLSNGTQLVNVEAASLTTGAGDDTVNLKTNCLGDFQGGDGFDSFNLDLSGGSSGGQPEQAQLYFGGGYYQGSSNGLTSFSGFENVSLVGSDGDSHFFVQFYEETYGGALSFDGNHGNDSLALYMDFFVTDVLIDAADDGTWSSNLGVTAIDIERFTVISGTGNDMISTGAGDDSLSGREGADRLDGGAGQDHLDGGEGNDVLIGGPGGDTLRGGLGADTFIFEALDHIVSSDQPEQIWDFSSEEGDIIDLADVDADATTAGDQAFTFIGDAAFSGIGVGGELRFETDGYRSLVQGDVDGDGIADFTLLVDSFQSLSAADFVL